MRRRTQERAAIRIHTHRREPAVEHRRQLATPPLPRCADLLHDDMARSGPHRLHSQTLTLTLKIEQGASLCTYGDDGIDERAIRAIGVGVGGRHEHRRRGVNTLALRVCIVPVCERRMELDRGGVRDTTPHEECARAEVRREERRHGAPELVNVLVERVERTGEVMRLLDMHVCS